MLTRTAAAKLAAQHVKAAGPQPRGDVTKILTDRCGSATTAHEAVSWAISSGMVEARGQLLRSPEVVRDAVANATPAPVNGSGAHVRHSLPAQPAEQAARPTPAWTPTRLADRPDAAVASAPATAAVPPSPWSALQQALLEQRTQHPEASEQAQIQAIADRVGLTAGDVTRSLRRAMTPLPPRRP